MDCALECAGVIKRFGNFAAVDDVSLRVPRGAFFSILGPSGCGKTTLMRMFAGFETPDAGDILINGKSALAAPPNKRNVKMVFQHLALFPMMNVEGNIAYGLRANGVGRKEAGQIARETLGRVGLPNAGEKEIYQLSGGQKQRVAIARCMALKPEALLLDEPLGSLDLKLREHMKIELKNMQRKFETTFLYITHDQSEALVMSDQVAVMNRGKFEQIGSPRELYQNPQTPFVAAFVGDNNRWRGKIKSATGVGFVAQTEGGMLVKCLAGRAPPPQGADVEIFVRPEFIVPADGSGASEDINKQNATVEDVLFNGANSRLLARADEGDLLEAALPPAFSEIRRGQKISLCWRATDSVWFFADAAAPK